VGGGGLLYVHDSLVSSECAELTRFNTEAVWCKISTGSRPTVDLFIGCVCRSSNADVLENLELYSVIKAVCGNDVVIIGHFNYPGINWQTLDCDASSVNFLELVAYKIHF